MNRIIIWSKWAVFTIALIGIGFIFGLAESSSAAVNVPFARVPLKIESELINETERVFSEIYNRVAPGVVSITTARRATADSNTFFNASTGSGFVVDMTGHIVTNFHVIEGADRLEIRFFDGTITRGEIVGTDPDSDLAVIRVDVPAERLRPVPLADSNQLFVGQTVLAIGNPFDNNWTLTTGIISALNRRIVGLGSYAIGGVIQTDAAINPGNSGGPLLNLDGEVIGVNSQIESQSRVNSGVGFAAPSNLVDRVMVDLIAEGTVRYSYIGITNREIDLDLIENFRLPDNIQGVAVRQALDGSPAAVGGIRTIGNNSIDVITAINGEPMRDFDQMVGWLAINTTPGETVNLTVYRSGDVLNIPVTLSERPSRR